MGRSRPHAIPWVLAAVGGLALGFAPGCGEKERPPPIGAPAGAVRGSDDGGDGLSTFGRTKPPGCGALLDGGPCDCIDLPVVTNPPNLHFVVDVSGSMSGKLLAVRKTMRNVVVALGPRARFAITLYPDTAGGSNSCLAGKQVLPLTLGDDPPGVLGKTGAAVLEVTNVNAVGGTPTAATLRALLPVLRDERAASGGRPTFVVLATDGGPNCNDQLGCAEDRCIPNIEQDPRCPAGTNCCASATGASSCLDDTATLDAVKRLAAENFATFVIGIPGSAPYGALLDEAAIAGGTALSARPFYYRVDAADEAALTRALKRVAARITATCTYTLAADAEPNAVNVYLDDVLVAKENGSWKVEGSTVTLLGATCDRVLDGETLDVRIIAGCPTVLK